MPLPSPLQNYDRRSYLTAGHERWCRSMVEDGRENPRF